MSDQNVNYTRLEREPKTKTSFAPNALRKRSAAFHAVSIARRRRLDSSASSAFLGREIALSGKYCLSSSEDKSKAVLDTRKLYDQILVRFRNGKNYFHKSAFT